MHHDFFGSDHRVLTLYLWPLTAQISQDLANVRPFLFEPYWQLANNFPQVIEECWSSSDC